MFAYIYMLFDRLNMDKYPNIEHTLSDQTDERSLGATWKMWVLLPSHERMLANNISMVFRQNSTFSAISLHKLNQIVYVLYYRLRKYV